MKRAGEAEDAAEMARTRKPGNPKEARALTLGNFQVQRAEVRTECARMAAISPAPCAEG